MISCVNHNYSPRFNSSNSILNYSGSLKSGFGGGGVLTSSNMSSTISVAIFNAKLVLTYF